jgi:PhnB protein
MAKVNPIPDGYSTVTPFLNVKGAAEAIEFYKRAFGAEERGRMPGPNNSVMHAEIKIGDSVIMISDAIMTPATQSNLHLYVPDVDAAWKRATGAGAQVIIDLANQFWGDRYGVLSDKWGNRWSLASHVEEVPAGEMEKRAAEAMKKVGKPST